jgi:hypothetical protein
LGRRSVFFNCVKDELIVIDDVAKIVHNGTVVSSACHARNSTDFRE